nr:MAG TPA: hypothetical protein [Bacteriophage sp.]
MLPIFLEIVSIRSVTQSSILCSFVISNSSIINNCVYLLHYNILRLKFSKL